MSATPGFIIDASGDADANLDIEDFNTDKTAEEPKDPKLQAPGGQIFGGISVTRYPSEQKPLGKTFFGQNHVPDISELGLRLDGAGTSVESINRSNVAAYSASVLDGAEGANGTPFSDFEDPTSRKVESELEVVGTDSNLTQHPQHIYFHQEPPLQSRKACEDYIPEDGNHSGSQFSAASIRSANSDERDLSDDGTSEEPLVTTYSDELNSQKLTGGRSAECVVSEAEELYDSDIPGSSHYCEHCGNCKLHNNSDTEYDGVLSNEEATTQGARIEDLSPEQFRRQLDSYMEADTTDHIRYRLSSSSDESIHQPSDTISNGIGPKRQDNINDHETDDEDDDALDVEDVMPECKRGPKFVSLPRSRKRHPSRKLSCRYWSNAGLMVREPRGPLCLHDEPSSLSSQKYPLCNSSPKSSKEYIHPLLRSYNDVRGGSYCRSGDNVLSARKTDQGHGDRGDAHQNLYQEASSDSPQKKSDRISVYSRVRKFFKTFLRKKRSGPETVAVSN